MKSPIKISISLNEIILRALDNNVDFNKAIDNYYLTEDIIDYFADKWNWEKLVTIQKVSGKTITRNVDKFNIFTWQNICRYQILTENDINRYKNNFDIVCWLHISRYQYMRLSEKFIDENYKHINMIILQFKKFSETFLEKHFNEFDYVDIKQVCENQKLSDEFIKNHITSFDEYDWLLLSLYQRFSENFLNEYYNKFKNTVALNNIYGLQKISKEFVFKHIEDLTSELYDKILNNSYLSDKDKTDIRKEIVRYYEENL